MFFVVVVGFVFFFFLKKNKKSQVTSLIRSFSFVFLLDVHEIMKFLYICSDIHHIISGTLFSPAFGRNIVIIDKGSTGNLQSFTLEVKSVVGIVKSNACIQ